MVLLCIIESECLYDSFASKRRLHRQPVISSTCSVFLQSSVIVLLRFVSRSHAEVHARQVLIALTDNQAPHVRLDLHAVPPALTTNRNLSCFSC